MDTGKIYFAIPLVLFFVPKISQGAKIMKNDREKLDAENYLKKPAVSNSRLNRHTMYTPEPKLSFDAMTIVGNLNKNNAHKGSVAKF